MVIKKNTSIIALLLFIIAGTAYAAEKTYNIEDVIEKDGFTYDKKTNELVNGIIQIYYESGELRGEIPIKDGLPEGVAKYYSETGMLTMDRVYRNGKKHGMERFYNDGKMFSERRYENNKLISGYRYGKNGEKIELSGEMIQEYNSSLPHPFAAKEAEAVKKIETAMKTIEKPTPDNNLTREEIYIRSIDYFSKAFEQAGYSYFDTINEVADDLKNHRDRIPFNGESRHKLIIMLLALQKSDCQYYKVDCLKLYPPETQESVKWLYENSGWSF